MKKIIISTIMGMGFGFIAINQFINFWGRSLKIQVVLVLISSVASSAVVYFMLQLIIPFMKRKYRMREILILGVASLGIGVLTWGFTDYRLPLPTGGSGEHWLEIIVPEGDELNHTKRFFKINELKIDGEKVDPKRIEQTEGQWEIEGNELFARVPGKLRYVYEGDQATSIEMLVTYSYSRYLIGIDGRFRQYTSHKDNGLDQTLVQVQIPPLTMSNRLLVVGSSVYFVAGLSFIVFSIMAVLFHSRKLLPIIIIAGGIPQLALGRDLIKMVHQHQLNTLALTRTETLLLIIGFMVYIVIVLLYSSKRILPVLVILGVIIQLFVFGSNVLNMVLRHQLIPSVSPEIKLLFIVFGFVLYLFGTIKISHISMNFMKSMNLKKLAYHFRNKTTIYDGLVDILIFTAPIAIFTLISNQGWLFDSQYVADPWVYEGHFYYPGYGDHISASEIDYKVSRLSYIIPGYLIYKVFGPIIGHYLITLGVLIASLVLFYLFIRIIFNRRVSLASTFTLSCFTYFQGNLGWSYHNGAFALYFIFTFLIMAYATTHQPEKSFICIFIGGCSMASALIINPTSAVLIPCVFMFFILLGKEPFRKYIWYSLLWFMAGIFFTFIILGSVHFLSGAKTFEFYLQLLSVMLTWVLEKAMDNKYLTYLATLLLIASALVLAYFKGLIRTEDRFNKTIIHSQLLFLSSFLIFLLLGLITGQNILGVPHISFSLVIPAMISLSGVFALIFQCESTIRPKWMAVSLGLLFIVPLLLASSLGLNEFFDKLLSVPYGKLIVLGVWFSGILGAIIIKNTKISIILMIAILSMMNLSAGRDLGRYSIFGPDCSISKDTYYAYIETAQFLKGFPYIPEKGRYWYDLNEKTNVQPENMACSPTPIPYIYRALSRGLLALSVDKSPLDESRTDIEDWSDEMIDSVGFTGYLIGFSSPSNWGAYYKRIENRVEKSCYLLEDVEHTVITQGGISFRISILKLAPRSGCSLF